MAWVKVDDQFFRHPKVLAAGRDARDLYLVGLCYCGQSLTDGFIPSAAVRVLAAEAEIETGQASAARLIAVGLWEECEGGYVVHDYLDYQPTKERVLATREVRAEAGRRGGKQKASNLLDKTASKTLAKSKQNSAPYPSRTHPVPLTPQDVGDHPPTGEVQEGGMPPPAAADAPSPLPVLPRAAPKPSREPPRDVADRFARFWQVWPKRVGRAEALAAFQKLRPTDEDIGLIVAAIPEQSEALDWPRENYRYCPNPATWLNQRRWEDDPPLDRPRDAHRPYAPHGSAQVSDRTLTWLKQSRNAD